LIIIDYGSPVQKSVHNSHQTCSKPSGEIPLKQLIQALLSLFAGAEIIYSNHAQERMTQRKVSKAQIANTIQSPDQRLYEDDGDTRFIKSIRRQDKQMRPLHVVAKPLKKRFFLITSQWLVKTIYVRGEEDDGSLTPSKKR
jgi:hypothetical protein